MNIKFSPPDLSEKEIMAVADTLKSGWITTGPKTKLFERRIADYCGVNKAACLNSATAGLELVLRVLGVGEGDEVITSAYTYTASASVIEHVGAKIVLCDIVRDGYEMDYDRLESLITDKTKVVIPVDLGGKICDYDRIFSVIRQKSDCFVPSNDLQKKLGRIVVLADAAHSFGSIRNGKISGCEADFTSFSFHAVKNLTTAEGGAVVWKSIGKEEDEQLYRLFMLWSLHGQSKDALTKVGLGAWEYDIEMLGYKCNMTDIMAAIGLAQLDRYPQILLRRKKITETYDASFLNCGIETLCHYGEDFCSNGHLYLTRIDGIGLEQRNEIILRMAQKGISCNVHYKPLPLLTAYRKYGFDIDAFPNAYRRYENEITLPSHTLMTDEEVQYVISNYRDIVANVRR